MREEIQERLSVLNRQFKAVDAIYRNAANWFGISESAFWILYIVSDGAEYTQYDLCSTWFYSKQTINSAITKLVSDGLITLEAKMDARNRKIIRLTAKGKRIVENTVERLKSAELKAFENMPEEDRTMFIKLFGRYLQNLNTEMNNV